MDVGEAEVEQHDPRSQLADPLLAFGAARGDLDREPLPLELEPDQPQQVGIVVNHQDRPVHTVLAARSRSEARAVSDRDNMNIP